MISLKTLEWDNVFSFGESNRLVLDESPVTQIVGLNGHGKSSIALILEELLFNKNSKGVKKTSVPNRYLDGSYRIKGTFTAGNNLYEVSVSRHKSTSKVTLLENGVDISSHTATNTYKTIENIIGKDFKTFSQLVYQNPASSLQFLTATDTNRKRFLVDLLQLTEYSELLEVFKNASKDSSQRLAAVESKLNTVQKWLNSNILESTEELPVVSINISTEEEQQEIARLSEELKNIESTNRKIDTNNQYKQMLSKIDLNANEQISVTEITPTRELESEQAVQNHLIRTLEADHTKYRGLGTTCPTCKSKIEEETLKEILEGLKLKIFAARKAKEDIEEKLKEIRKNNSLYEMKIKTQQRWEDLYRSIDRELPEKPYSQSHLEEKISKIKASLSEKQKKMQELTQQNMRAEAHNARVKVILEQTEKFQEELEETSELLEAERALASRLDILKRAFGTNGLLAYEIENMVKDLEELTNQYLADFTDGRFAIEFQVASDKLNVVILDNANSISIEELSSGELARVNTSALLAIRKLMNSLSKNKINILFLDEVISTLDDYGKERLVEVLMREEGLNTFVVSHGWSHPLLNKVHVVKEDNISRIE